MSEEMTSAAQAAAWHGIALNKAFPLQDRLQAALQALAWYEVELNLADAERSPEGICGNEAPRRQDDCSIPVECELRHGHASEWHQGHGDQRWRSGPEMVRRAAVIEAARAYARRYHWIYESDQQNSEAIPSIKDEERYRLIAAVDALDGADIDRASGE